MSGIDTLAKDLHKIITESDNKKPSPYDTEATVKDVEGDIAWVEIPGSNGLTPVSKTINANPGDNVKVRISGGRAWLMGNSTFPPTDDGVALRADYTANLAVKDAASAAVAAENAEKDATRAAIAADRAETSANEAKASATEANNQATYATRYANNALTQLSTVESVVDTLNWIAEHSTFVPTTDTTVQTGKIYYLPNNNVLALTSGTTELNGITFVVDAEAGTVTANGTATAYTGLDLGVPDVTAGDKIWLSGCSGGSYPTYWLKYYEAGGAVFVYDGTKWTTAVANAHYRIGIQNGYVADNLVFTPKVATSNDGYEFAIVANPTGNPTTQGYFELDTTEAVRDYVKAHLALTDDGLYILNDSSAYKMLLANDGMYIQAPNAQTVNQSTAKGNVIRSTDGTVIAHLGYDVGAGESTGTEATAPYYSLGTRLSNADTYSASSTYKVGDVCRYNNKIYVCMVAINTAETWTANHWAEAKIGNWSTVEGINNVAMYICHAEGAYNKILGNYNHGEGVQNVITINSAAGSVGGSHVEGYGNIVDAGYAHAEGTENTVTKNAGHVEGRGCVVEGFGGHAQNEYTAVGSNYQTAMGKYNIKDSSNVYALIIGNGSSSSRSNALTVDWNGNVNIANGAKYKINGTNLSASDVSALPLSGDTMTGQIKTSFNSAVAMGSYQATATTVDGLADELRFSSGCVGSANIATAYTKDNITVSTKWYNFFYVPHRSGGINGAASGDNCNYGHLTLYAMTGTAVEIFDIWLNGNNGAISKLSKYYTSADRYTRSSAGTLDWTSTADGDSKVIMKSALAFWNGAYSGTSSTLKYSANGEIIGTNTAKVKTTFTPTSGTSYSSYGGCYYETYGKMVHVHVGVSGLTANTGTTIFTLPSAIRPSSIIFGHGTGGTAANIGYVEVRTNGVVYVYSNGNTYVGADVTYMV